jgi:hypothetical protein
VHVHPEILVEVAFKDVQESALSGGMALRLAGVKRDRPDKRCRHRRQRPRDRCVFDHLLRFVVLATRRTRR